MCTDLIDWLQRYVGRAVKLEGLRRRAVASRSSVSHAAWDVHAVHGMHAMHSMNGLGTARGLIKLSGQAPDLLPILVPYARTSDRRSTEPLRAKSRPVNQIQARRSASAPAGHRAWVLTSPQSREQ